MAPPRSIISVKELHKWFGPLHVLNGINLEVHAGQKICIIGPSGSGKSTLLRCINFLEEPDSGSVWLDGEPMGFVETARGLRRRAPEADINRMRSAVGMVFQNFNLWGHMTVLGNIIEAPIQVRGMDRKAAQEARPAPARADRAGREEARLSLAAVRRPAAARRDRAGARDGAEDHAVRRADLVA
jgi:ABC-type histidine transport system ATPase subunit